MKIEDLIGNAHAFPILRQYDFFNHAGVSPLPHVTANAMRDFLWEAEHSVYIGSTWFTATEALRLSAAKLINAHRDEIAIVKNTAEGISIAANTIDWKAGDVIVLTNIEYPANVYPWMEVARRFGVELILVAEETDSNGRRAVPLEKILKAAGHPRCRLVALSHVEYASGQRHDLVTIGRFCRERSILFCVDAIQSAGALPIDVHTMPIDYLATGGQKWLLGPTGAGFFYCRRELLPTLRPLIIGAGNVINDQDYGNFDYTLKSDARRLEAGTNNLIDVIGLRASIDLLLSISIEAVAQRLKSLGDRLEAGLVEKGYAIASPRAGEQWSGMVCFTSDKHDQKQIIQSLQTEHKTEILIREGRLRVAPHFYNTEAQIDALLDHLP